MIFSKESIVQLLKYTNDRVRSVIPFNARQGSVYRKTLELLTKSQWWDKQQIEEYQYRQLLSLLNYAYLNVAYYKTLFMERGLKPTDIHSISELSKIPFLTKDIICSRKLDFLSGAFKKSQLSNTNTGGTTGSPLHFWYDRRNTNKVEKAYYWRMWQWHGYNPGDRCLIIKGAFDSRETIKYTRSDNTLFIFNPVFSNQKVRRYLDIISNFKPAAIRGYPSLIYLFAHFINTENLKIKFPLLKAIFCASEKTYDFQKEEMSRAFGCKVVDSYGHNERVVAMQQCEQLNNFHIIPEYGITEIISDDSVSGNINDGMGEIVGTGFNNHAFPLIRYRTGDWAIPIASDSVCGCGRQFAEVKEILGRSGDFIVTPKGNIISPTCLEFSMRYIHNFKDVQIVQDEIDLLTIFIIPTDKYETKEGLAFADSVCSRVGDGVKADVKLVDRIERAASKKSRFVVSKMAKQVIEKH